MERKRKPNDNQADAAALLEERTSAAKRWSRLWVRFRPVLQGVLLAICLATPLLLWATDAIAKRSRNLSPDITTGLGSNPIQLVVLLGAMSLIPFLLMMITSFVKIAVVLSIIRSALGTQQNPPTQVITGMAIILTVYVMVPVGMDVHDTVKPVLKQMRDGSQKTLVKYLPKLIEQGSAPIKQFLSRHSHLKERAMFYNLGLQLHEAQEEQRRIRFKKAGKRFKPKPMKTIARDDLIVLIPSFVISELKEAFQIGFLIFLPFLIVDMVVANILLALGMHMLSPTTISLPFKLLLFVLVDGWYLLTKGLVLGYL